MKPTVLYYSMLQFQPDSLSLLHDRFHVIELEDPEEDTPEVLKEIDCTFAPLGFFCGNEKIDQCLRLKAIASNTTGVPHIDVRYAYEKKIAVISLANEQEFLQTITPTAEHTWGLLLALIRRTPWSFESVKNGIWNRRLFPGQAMLSSMSLGIIGLGRLGSIVARYGLCFGMRVQYYDPYVDDSGIDGVNRVSDLRQLVSENDVISLHVPHNEKTENLLNADVFAAFKSGSVFINTARAEIIDPTALLEQLRNGRIAGAAMDVFPGEFKKAFSGSSEFSDHSLLHYARGHDNLLLTPHIGGSTYDAWAKTEQYTIKKLIELFQK